MLTKVTKISDKPLYSWNEDDTNGIMKSGWSPLKKSRISFSDTIKSKSTCSLIVEPKAPGTQVFLSSVLLMPYWYLIYKNLVSTFEANAFFFEINSQTGKIDMTHRSKPFRGIEETKVYRDCTYFSIEQQRIRRGRKSEDNKHHQSVIHLTSCYSDMVFPTGLNLTQEIRASLSKKVQALITSVQYTNDNVIAVQAHRLFCSLLEYQNQCMQEAEYKSKCVVDNVPESMIASEKDMISVSDLEPHYIFADSMICCTDSMVYHETEGDEGYIMEIYPLKIVEAICISNIPILVDGCK